MEEDDILEGSLSRAASDTSLSVGVRGRLLASTVSGGIAGDARRARAPRREFGTRGMFIVEVGLQPRPQRVAHACVRHFPMRCYLWSYRRNRIWCGGSDCTATECRDVWRRRSSGDGECDNVVAVLLLCPSARFCFVIGYCATRQERVEASHSLFLWATPFSVSKAPTL